MCNGRSCAAQDKHNLNMGENKMRTSVVGYPRIGARRELKFWTESYFKGFVKEDELLTNARTLRATHWQEQKNAGIDFIPANDFSFYDSALDTAAITLSAGKTSPL